MERLTRGRQLRVRRQWLRAKNPGVWSWSRQACSNGLCARSLYQRACVSLGGERWKSGPTGMKNRHGRSQRTYMKNKL